MALKGKLRDFNTTQLLNLVSLAKKSGAMELDTDEDSAQLYFRQGKLIKAATKSHPGRLADILFEAGKLSQEQMEAITRHNHLTDKSLGIDLIKSRIVSQHDIVQSVKDYMLNVVYSLFSWADGDFTFQQNALPSGDDIAIPLNLDNVILEGSRRIQEHERLLEELPDLTVLALKVTDKPLRDVKLTPDDWRVISHIHPRNTIANIAQANNMDEFQIRKIVYGMLQAGLIELTKPEGLKKQKQFSARFGGNKGFTPEGPAVKRSVIERLITRIKRI